MALAAAVARPTDRDTEDLDLVAAIRAGDDRGFELLYLRYQPQIAAYVRGMVRDHGRAEDITQDVFISALRRIRETEREIAFKPWVYEIAKNACIDAYRRSRHTNEVSFDAHDALGAGDHDRLAGMGATPDAAVDAKVDLDNLRGAFGGLSELHHQLLVMRELEGLSYRDIGERLGMSGPAVESTLFRARRRLGEEYDELVSGKRCLRVRAIVDGGGRSAGLRDQRRMDRHISHCQPCRRHALAAGVDLQARPPLRPAAAKIAALLPLPAIMRRRNEEDAAVGLLGSPSHAPVAQWTANVAGSVDPGSLVGWSKAVLAAATVAVAGVGAGAAITEREALTDFISRAPAIALLDGSSSARPDGRSSGIDDAARKPAGDADRPAAGGVNSDRPTGAGTSADPAAAAPPETADRHPGLGGGDGAGKPTRPSKPPGGAQGSGAANADPLGPVNDVLEGTLQAAPGATGAGVPAAPGGSDAATSATGAIGEDIPANSVDTLPGVQSAVDTAAGSQPVGDLATSAVSP